MAKERKKMIHVHSSVSNKQPLASLLEVGELAVNNAAGNEFISTKNTDDEVIRFSSDNKVLSIIENKTVMPYKGEVLEPTEQDLLENKSQIVIGLNQVATPNTAGYDQVNGATDMHGDEINPSSDGGKTNGAGFAINMDKYAMIGANPSFSSVTTTDILSEDELFIGNNKELEEDVPMPDISVYGSGVKLHANDGKVGITATDDINISGTHDGNFNVDNNMCLGAGNEMKIGAVEKLTIGEDCSGTETGVVEIKGGEIIINREATNNLSATTVEGALEELADKVAAAGDGYITGGHVDSATGIIDVDVVEHSGVTITGLEDYINNRLGDISGIAKRSEVTEETIDDEPKLVISFFDKDDNELEDLQIVLDDYYNKGEINDMELVIAAALNDLNDRVITISGDVQVLNVEVEELKNRRDNYVTDGEVNGDTGIIYLNMSASDEPAEVTGLSQYMEDKTDGLFKSVDYVTSSETIVFKDKDGDEVGTIDASRFVKDGMVMSVEVGTPSGGTHAGVECLIITWNNEAAPEVDPLVTEIPLTDLFDPAILDDYYTRDEVNQMLGENFALDLFSGESFSSVTDVILKDERVVAAALNDLNSRVEELDDIKLDKDDYIDSYVESGHVDSGNGIINLEVKNKGEVPVDGLAEYLDGKIAAVSGDTNNFVTGGSVDSGTGMITLVVPGKDDAPVSGLSQYIDNRLSTFNTEAYEIYDMTNINMSIPQYNTDGNISSAETASETLFDEINAIWQSGKIPVADIVLPGETGNILIPLTKSSKRGYNAFYGSESQTIFTSPGVEKGNANTEHLVIKKESGKTVIMALCEFSDSDKYVHATGDTMTGDLVMASGGIDRVKLASGMVPDGETTLDILSIGNETGLTAGGGPVFAFYDEKGGLGSSDTKFSAYRIGSGPVLTINPGASDEEDLLFVSGNTTVDGNVTGDGFYVDGKSNDYVILASGGTMPLSSITPADVWVNTSGDTMTGALTFKNGNNTVMTVDPTVNDVLDVSANAKISGTLTIDGSDVLIDPASRMYWTGATLPQDPREDYGFVQGIDRRTSLDKFLLPSGGTANSGKTVTIGSDGKWQLSEDKWVHLTGNETIRGNKTFNNSVTLKNPIYINDSTTGHIVLNANRTLEVANNAGGSVVISPSVTSNSFIKSGGTATQVLLANGGVKELSEITPTDVWVNESGDTMTGSLVFRPSGQLSNTIALVASNGNITCVGNVTAAGAMYSSDKRLKENIKFIPNDDLENAKKIDFKEFNFIADKSSQKVGVIAQELKENGLGKLTKQNDAGYLTVDYISLLCLKIAQLEKEIKELKEGK